MPTSIYNASLVTAMQQNRTVQTYYNRNFTAINAGRAIGKPASEAPITVAEYRDSAILERCCDIVASAAVSDASGGGSGGDPIASYTFMASAVMLPGAHPGMGTYFTYTGQVESVDWGDGTTTQVVDGGPTTQTLLHTYALAASFTVTIKGTAGSLSALSFYSAVQGSQVGVTGFNLAGSPALISFDCRSTGVTSLAGISACPGLLTLLASGSAVAGTVTITSAIIQTIQLTGCVALTGLIATGVAGLTTLGITGCSALATFTVNGSALVSLDFTGCSGLINVNLDSNSLLVFLGINMMPSAGLLTFTAANCPALVSLDFTANPVIQSVVCDNCTSLLAITALSNSALVTLFASGCTVLGGGGISLTGCTGLVNVDMSGCASLLFLDLTGCTTLHSLYLSGCSSLTTITMTGVGQIQQVYADGCALTQGTVDSILAQCWISETTYVSVSGTVDTSGGTSSGPSSAGQTYIVNLTTPPSTWNITTN